ncbi:MAG TPA: hypothetical protein VIK54_15785 [Acidimicrobiia bacterium]
MVRRRRVGFTSTRVGSIGGTVKLRRGCRLRRLDALVDTAVAMIVRQTRFYRLAEFFFDEEPRSPHVDVIEHVQRSRPLPGARCSDFYTLHVDLTQDPETLFSGLSETYQYEIRRAERDELKDEAWMSARGELVNDFIAFFDGFARGKGLPPAPAKRLHTLAKAGVLDLSTVTRRDDILVWHAYLRAGNRARLLHSASLFREHNDTGMWNLIGRANRYLHWHDLLRYKDAGIPLFDFGGWYSGQDDEELLRINAFKESFGGRVVPEFHCAVPTSTRGRMVLFARRLRNR